MTRTDEYQAPAAEAAPVRLSDLTRALGISLNTRREIIEQGLVTPVHPVRQGRPTCVHAEDAERVRRAATVAAICGLSIVIVLKVLSALPLP
jgi:hypothetical protein